MSQFIIKNFMKKKSVKCIFMKNDRKVITKYLVVKDDFVSFEGHTYIIDPELFMLGKNNWPTFYFHLEDAKPINMLGFELSDIDSGKLDARIDSHVLRDLFGSFQKKIDPSTMTMLFGFITLAGIGALGYYLTDKYHEMMLLLEEIRQVLRIVGGA